MTTIAYRDGMLAADTRVTSGNTISPQRVHKIAAGENYLGAACGHLDFAAEWLRWIMSPGGAVLSDMPEVPKGSDDVSSCGYYIERNGTVHCVTATGSYIVQAEYMADGSGQDFALTALLLGRSAAEAVDAACSLDVWSGGHVEYLTIDCIGTGAMPSTYIKGNIT